jgi:membrane-bound metal-dependent hydrolase YbcI (DUF457 family)
LVEPLLHFVVPLVTLRAIGLDWKQTLFASFIALTPDLDVFFFVHRSASHSIIILLAIIIPILIAARITRNSTVRDLTLLAAFAITTHLVMDVFQTGTPLLWPLYNHDLQFIFDLNFRIGGGPILAANTLVETSPIHFGSFESFDAPLITAEGAGISLILMMPVLFQIVINLRKTRKKVT